MHSKTLLEPVEPDRHAPKAYNMYDTIENAAKWLLVDACRIASSMRLKFAVCGGWSTVLRNSRLGQHPGTRDVDLLFEAGVERHALQRLAQAFLDRGYVASAKHEFQLLLAIDVNSRKFVFNVDFLHPMEAEDSSRFFVDHLEMPVPMRDFHPGFYRMKSIGAPEMGFVFNGFVEPQVVSATALDGKIATVDVPLIDEVGLLVSKSGSFGKAKRPRDIFDIFLAVTQPLDNNRFHEQLATLRELHEDEFAAIAAYWDAVNTPAILRRTCHAFPDLKIDEGGVREALRSFLLEWELPPISADREA